MTVFIDTSAIYALVDRAADQYPRADETLRDLSRQRQRLRTHSHVLVETAALLQSRIGLDAVQHLVTDVQPALDVFWVDSSLHAAAVAALLAAQRRGVSLVDWTSFELMRREGITTAFAFDEDFGAQGFSVIPSGP